MTFSERLRALRKQKGLTQEQLSLETGLKKGAIVQYELDQREPNFEAVLKLREYFGDSIFGSSKKTGTEESHVDVTVKIATVIDVFDKAIFSLDSAISELTLTQKRLQQI